MSLFDSYFLQLNNYIYIINIFGDIARPPPCITALIAMMTTDEAKAHRRHSLPMLDMSVSPKQMNERLSAGLKHYHEVKENKGNYRYGLLFR